MYIYPDIVEGFHCELCGTCCRNDWQVTLDEASYERNRQYFSRVNNLQEMEQAFVVMTHNQAIGEYAYIRKQESGACWFLSGNNLCRLHKKAGHQHLDAVCQTFPRYPMNTQRGIEVTLSFSCPAVLRRIQRLEPLRIVRSEKPPVEFLPENYVASVFPGQQAKFTPLYYYFELEHHFIDIVQCRGLSIAGRLELLEKTVRKLEAGKPGETFGQWLQQQIYQNYAYMDSLTEQNLSLAEVLVEHFFVNFLFKKPLYLYGLIPAVALLVHMWQEIETMQRGKGEKDRISATQAAINNLELEYGHDRQSLLVWMAKR